MTALYIAAGIAFSLIIAVLSIATVRSCKYRRSLMASLVEIYLRLANPRIGKKKLEGNIEKKLKRGFIPYELPRFAKNYARLTEISGVSTAVLEGSVKGTAILYLYGGGYFREPRRRHIRFLIKLSRRTSYSVFAPLYPKAPFATADEAKRAVRGIYLKLCEDYGRVILMGDSSGGGLALLLLQLLKSEGIKLPERALLFSPWVDLSMSSPDTKEYERRDPLIWTESALSTARSFAGNYQLSDPSVSPLFGSLSELCPIHLFAGDRELLFPQAYELHLKLLRLNARHSFKIGKGMNHVYQIYPILEARDALAEITKIIK